MGLRFKLPPGGDVPPAVAARRLGLSEAQFQLDLPRLLQAGFPSPDPVTGNFMLEAIDAWRKARYPHLFPEQLTSAVGARNARDVVGPRLARIRGGG